MKKTLLLSSALLLTLVILFSILPMSAFAANSPLHNCAEGTFEPYIQTDNNMISITGCETCHNSLGLPYYQTPFVYIYMSNGNVFNVTNYEIPLGNFNYAMESLAGSENEVLLVYKKANANNKDFSPEKPTEMGDYVVALTTKKLFNYYLENDYSETYSDEFRELKVFVSTAPFSLAHTCSKPYSLVYFVENGQLCAKCSCGFALEGSASLEAHRGTKFCGVSEVCFSLQDNGWSENGFGELVLLYEGRNSTTYPRSDVPPTEKGDYTVSLAPKSVYEATPELIDKLLASPIDFTVDDDLHIWDYTPDGRSLVATCPICGETARVTLDSSAVYETARHLDASGIKEELFYEENWSRHKTIMPYRVIYNGKEIVSASTTEYETSIIKPEGTGNYQVQLAIMEDPFDITTILVKSDAMPFYVAGYSMSRCQVVDYGPNEIAMFTKPRFEDGVYYVNSLSELQWCVYNQTDDMNIVLTNDIVVNPITVTEKGNVSSGAIYIYKWRGFGYDQPFTGSIDGQGYTIYGLYVPANHTGDNESYQECGLINYGENCSVKNLTIESSYIKGHGAVSAFIGAIGITDGYNGDVDGYVIRDCYSLHNLLISDNQAGGLIGLVWTNTDTCYDCSFRVLNCFNNSTVTAPVAGGIIAETTDGIDGLCNASIEKCYNYGKITGTQYAAGIIGALNVRCNTLCEIHLCINTGHIQSDYCEAGIVAWICRDDETALMSACVDQVKIYDTANTGSFYANSEIPSADIVALTGSDDYYTAGVLGLKNNYYSKSVPYYSGLVGVPSDAAKKISSSDISKGKICELFGHVKSFHYSNVVPSSCTTDGSKQVLCATCAKELQEYRITIPAHGHYMQDGKCVFCESDPVKPLGASIFSSGSITVMIVVAVLLLGAGAAVVVVKKKKSVK